MPLDNIRKLARASGAIAPSDLIPFLQRSDLTQSTQGTEKAGTFQQVLNFIQSGLPNVTSVAWGNVTGKPTSISGYGITDAASTAGNYTNPPWINTLGWGKITGAPTTLSGYGITDPVVLSSGSYTDPSWIHTLNWSKLVGTPTSVAGYGISDALSSSGSYYDPTWIRGISASKLVGVNPPRVTSIPYASSITPNCDTTDCVNVGVISGNLTVNNPIGDPRDKQTLSFDMRIYSGGTATIVYANQYAYGSDITSSLVPSASGSKFEQLWRYNGPDGVWRAASIIRGY